MSFRGSPWLNWILCWSPDQKSPRKEGVCPSPSGVALVLKLQQTFQSPLRPPSIKIPALSYLKEGSSIWASFKPVDSTFFKHPLLDAGHHDLQEYLKIQTSLKICM